MPDGETTTAWHVTPSAYLGTRPPEFTVPARPLSCYLTMRDGCRLAADVYLPQAGRGRAAPKRFPAILILTPYYRRFQLRPEMHGVEASPNTFRYREAFVPRGYAMVVVDVRGTGASFGTRDSFRSPKERDDCREIADWIVAQPWSDGSIGSTGISYLGATATFLASTGHAAIKAIAPLFAIWDTYTDHYYPGGVLLNRLAATYDELMVALDHDRRDLLKRFAYFGNPAFSGPQPVDEDHDGTLCSQAVREHLANFRMPDFITEFRFRDDRLPYDSSFGSHSFSPYHYAASIPGDVAIYSISGWLDGAGFANGAIARFLLLPNPRRHLLLGPWDHGARANASPWRDRPEPQFDILAEVLRFFDEYLMGRDTGLRQEAPVHYFSMHAEEWRGASAWPPIASSHRLFLQDQQALADAPRAAGEDTYAVDFTLGTGHQTRYERLAAIDARDYYADWSERETRMLCYTSAPLEQDVEVTGHPMLTLWLASSELDAAVHAYLSEVEPDGRTRYVTEGVLRAVHRREKERPCSDPVWSLHSFARADAQALAAGQVERLRFALLPISWTFRRGSSVRLAISGADADHYENIPHGRPPVLSIKYGERFPSMIELPWHAAGQ